MKKIILLFLFVSLSFNVAISQILSPKVIATSGGYSANGGVSLSWTMGETFTATLQNGNVILTQGQQQPYVNLTLLNLKVYLEGFYGPTGMMDNFGTGGCLFVTGISANPLDADTVTVSAMNASTYALVSTAKGILKTNGTISVQFPSSVTAGSSYYIKVNHRNTIETWSANPVLFSATTTYDFTNAQTKAFGNNMVDVGTANSLPASWAFYSGDISDGISGLVGIQDGVVESQDYADMENAVTAVLTGYVVQDITGDGVVESADYSLMENNVSAVRALIRP